MNSVIRGAYICNQNRNQELDQRIYERNLTDAPIKMQYGIRSMPTRYVHMPISNCDNTCKENCGTQEIYDNEKMFTPASSLPFNGYQKNVDVETTLRGSTFPLQASCQGKYVPDSSSDLYKTTIPIDTEESEKFKKSLLFKENKFDKFNPNSCNIGNNLFNNHTRTQIKDIE